MTCDLPITMPDDNIPRVAARPSDKELEILGRQRPAAFKSALSEVGFCFALLTSMLMVEYFISGFNIILPTLALKLNIPSETQTWPSSVFALSTGAFLLPFGRLADIYGGYLVFMSGLLWFAVWSLIAGFSTNYTMLIFCRSLEGLGPAAFLPAGIMLLGSIYRPGPRKNLVFSMNGSCACIGFFLGTLFSGICAQYLPWSWYFWIGAVILFVVAVVAFLSVPLDRGSLAVKMDWWGTFTIVPGLILLVFALTDCSHAPHGWATPYIYITFSFGVLFLCAAIYIEGWVAEMPLLPFDLFHVKSMPPMLVALFLTYGATGIYLFYASFYLENVLGLSSMQTTTWFVPMAGGGLILATVGGFTLHLLPGKTLLVVAGIGYIMSMLLFAIMPVEPNKWAYVLPAMLSATIGVDITYNVTNIFITTSLPKHRQGLAGALINSLVYVGMSFFLGLADWAVASTTARGQRQSYKTAFWLAVACCSLSFVLVVGFVHLGKAQSDLTVEEKAELEAELLRISAGAGVIPEIVDQAPEMSNYNS